MAWARPWPRDGMRCRAVHLWAAVAVPTTLLAQYDIRLADGPNALRGRLEVLYHNQWYSVCKQGFDNVDAEVACRQLGSPSGWMDVHYYPCSWCPFIINDVNCHGSERTLFDCAYSSDVTTCQNQDDVSIECLPPSVGDVRLLSHEHQVEGNLRITGGSTSDGRLEVYRNDEWGTICDTWWYAYANAAVACRQMGFAGGSWYTHGDTGDNLPIHIDYVECDGDEARLVDCSYASWTMCTHARDVGVRCDTHDEGALRWDTDFPWVLSVFTDGEWGTICFDGFSIQSAHVACRQMGHSRALGFGLESQSGYPEITITNVQCVGNEGRLLDCPYSSAHASGCGSNAFTNVKCSRTRLVGPVTSPPSGRLEVYAGAWGTVCNAEFNEVEAQVACHSMGYDSGYAEIMSGNYEVGPSDMPILMGQVRCGGWESTLFDCMYADDARCTHAWDVGLVCGDDGTLLSSGVIGLVAAVGLIVPVLCFVFICWRRMKAASSGAAASGSVTTGALGAADPPPATLGVAQKQQTARLSVRVPKNGYPGKQLKMKTPHGVTIQVTVPPGFGPGMIFDVEYVIPDDVQVMDEDGNGVGQMCSAVALPKYWTNARNPNANKNDDDDGDDDNRVSEARMMPAFDQMVYVGWDQHDKFNMLLMASYVAKATQDRPCPKAAGACPRTPGGCPCVRPDGFPGLPTEFRVRRVIRVEDSEMWTRYEVKRDEVRAKRRSDGITSLDPPAVTDDLADKYEEIFEPLDSDLNEVYLWHGTAVRTALSIAQEDFRIDLAGTARGTMYGPGAYMAESSTKADEYARDEQGGYYHGVYALLLCRVCLGKFYYTQERDEGAGQKVMTGSYDSTLGDRVQKVGTFREFVVYNADQIYPEYVVLYSRVHKGDSEAKINAMFGMELHMELPVYWANCHKDPNKEAFHQQYRVRPSTLAILQRLVEASYTGQGVVKIISARRVENSTMWNGYVAFKQNMRQKAQRQGTSSAAFTPVEDVDNDPEAGGVLTMCHLQNEALEECISISNVELALNELLLWHGTSREACESIVRTDFVIPKGSQVKHGGRYGIGAYFAEDVSKSLQYAQGENGKKTLLLCRVCCGDIYYTEEAQETDALSKALAASKHSVLANPAEAEGIAAKFRAREFIVPEAQQVYPEYILEIEEVDAAEIE